MNTFKRPPNPNPRKTANFFSKLFFGYATPILKKGYAEDFLESDIYDPLPENQSSLLGNRLEIVWNKERNKKNPNFFRTVLTTFRAELTIMAILTITLELFLRLVQPILLGQLLIYFEINSRMTVQKAFFVGSMMCTANLLGVFVLNHYLYRCFQFGMKLRIACCSVVYRKALRLSQTALGETATGKVVNLLSNDVGRFDILAPLINYSWVSPISAVFVTIYLYFSEGISAVIGMSVVFLAIPIQVYCGRLSAVFRSSTALKTDERVRLMEEIISGILVIKMYAWEYPFSILLKLARKLEMAEIRKSGYVRGISLTFVLFTIRCAMYVAMVSMAEMGVPITANHMYVLSSFFAILSNTMSGMFVRSISEWGETLVALKRIEGFLMLEEYDERQHPLMAQLQITNGLTEAKIEKPEYAVCMNNISSTWNSGSSEQTLTDISIKIPYGKFVAIIGSVGSGKSSVLQTLLNELYVTKGSTKINGTVSYASQEAWVFASSIRQNILFGAPYDKARYKEVVNVCELRKDFDMFPDGDMTIVGDRGASLSGGQKARINLARAIYRDMDIYLLDDPLSAVDTRVAKQLFERCINGYLAKKTRILVTHQLQFLEGADHLVILKDGRIEMQGTFSEVFSSGLDFAQLLTIETELSETEKKDLEASEDKITRDRKKSSASNNSTSTLGLNENTDLKDKRAEESSKGKVNGNLLWLYFKKGNNPFILIVIVVLFFLAQILANSCDYFVSFWIDDEEYRRENSTWPDYQAPRLSQNIEIDIYSALIVLLFIVAFSRSIGFFLVCVSSSLALHKSFFMGVIKTSMHFFYTNPVGRILNRFSKDMGAVDEMLPKSFMDAFQNILIMFGAIILSAMVFPYFIIPIVFLGFMFYFHTKIYTRSSTNIKRLEGITKSPVFSHLSATLKGLSTIRAFKSQSILQNEFDEHQNLNSGAWFMFLTCQNIYGFGLDLLCFLFVTIIVFTFITFSGLTTAGKVGLVISQALSLTGCVQWGMRQSVEVQNQLMSAERIFEYTELKPEDNLEGDSNIPKEWPRNGKIKFINTQMKYDVDAPFILHNLNLEILPGQKIGIVGRTGAGKSSLIAALFRLAIIEGGIEIDDIDTKQVVLQELRKSISIIPQDPVLFSGTMRRNLDPFDEYDDKVLWSALEDVELKEIILQNNNLETRILDHGANFSVGQRQLVCLARAIIKKNKILLLDEATANVDPITDALIQKTIREKFVDCTVLTVAHRLHTIMDSDKVLVMAGGKIMEFDSPHLLCVNKNSIFYQMICETGPAMTEILCKAARDSYHAKSISYL